MIPFNENYIESVMVSFALLVRAWSALLVYIIV